MSHCLHRVFAQPDIAVCCQCGELFNGLLVRDTKRHGPHCHWQYDFCGLDSPCVEEIKKLAAETTLSGTHWDAEDRG